MMNVITVIVAAGSGSRFGADIPKQFLSLAGKPVLAHTVEAFRRALPEGEIVVVLAEDMIPFWQELCERHGFESPRVVAGGATRWESVKRALDSLADAPAHATVLIHDGARPLVTPAIITRAAACARNTDGALPAVAVTDSLRKLNEEETASEPVDRLLYRAVQTPQAFALWRLREAYRLPYQADFTDDASVLAAAGFANIVLVAGSPENIKITTPIDLLLAEAIVAQRAANELNNKE